MDKTEVIQFFNMRASSWDRHIIRNEGVIAAILDYGGIKAGVDVLDVACGTGVLFPDYLKRHVASLTGIDISAEMVKYAQGKFPNVNVICGDAETAVFTQKFDCVMIYNAFPHFSNPCNLIQILEACLKDGGRLTIAHGMSREEVNQHHHNKAENVSLELMHEEELAALLAPWFIVDTKISDDEKYIVSGTRKRSALDDQLYIS